MSHLKDFENEIKRTAMRPEDYERARERLGENRMFPSQVAHAFQLCARVDGQKTAVFENKDPGHTEYKRVSDMESRTAAPHSIEALHAACGALGEAGEVAEAFLDPRSPDGHVLEECSDLMFYLGMELMRRGFSFEEVARRGAEKLRRIYPEGFKER